MQPLRAFNTVAACCADFNQLFAQCFVDRGRKFPWSARHPFAPDIFVGIVQDLCAGITSNRACNRGERTSRPRARRDLEVEQLGSVGLKDGAIAKMHVGADSCARRGQIGDHLDADRRPPVARLENVRTRKPTSEVVTSSTMRGSVGRPADSAIAPVANLSIPSTAPYALGPL